MQTRRFYFIPRHVHLCAIGGQVIFLDLRRDKYLAIGNAERRALGDHVEGWPTDGHVSPEPTLAAGTSEPVIRSMLTRGLLTADAKYGKSATDIAPAAVNESLSDDDFDRRTRIRLHDLCLFMLACGRAKFALRWRSLEYAVDSVRERKRASLEQAKAVPDLARIRDLVTMFYRLQPFLFTAKDACLYDSLALVEFLALHGQYPTWVIGVHTQPFAAHSWVQHNETALNGPVEFLRRFTPILAV